MNMYFMYKSKLRKTVYPISDKLGVVFFLANEKALISFGSLNSYKKYSLSQLATSLFENFEG